MRQVIRRQHKALSTEDCYTFWLRRYMAALRQMPANLPSEKKLERFLTDLALRRDVAASTQNQALPAILYFYKCVIITHAEALSVGSPLDVLPVILPPLVRGSVTSTDQKPVAKTSERRGWNMVSPTQRPPPNLATPRRFPITEKVGNWPASPGARLNREPVSTPRVNQSNVDFQSPSRGWSQQRQVALRCATRQYHHPKLNGGAFRGSRLLGRLPQSYFTLTQPITPASGHLSRCPASPFFV